MQCYRCCEGGAHAVPRLLQSITRTLWHKYAPRSAISKKSVKMIVTSHRQHGISAQHTDIAKRIHPSSWTTQFKRRIPLHLFRAMLSDTGLRQNVGISQAIRRSRPRFLHQHHYNLGMFTTPQNERDSTLLVALSFDGPVSVDEKRSPLLARRHVKISVGHGAKDREMMGYEETETQRVHVTSMFPHMNCRQVRAATHSTKKG